MTTPTLTDLETLKAEHEMLTGNRAVAFVMSLNLLERFIMEIDIEYRLVRKEFPLAKPATREILGLPVYRVIEDDVLGVL